MCNVESATSNYLGVDLTKTPPSNQSAKPTPPSDAQSMSQNATRSSTNDVIYFSQEDSGGKEVGSWKDATIVVETERGKKVKVKAKTLGYVAVHGTLKKDDKDPNYTLTASAVGLVIAQLDSGIDCMRMGHFLMSKCAYALSRKTREDIVKKLPNWVLNWIRTCRHERKYVEPKYVEQEG